MNDNYYYEKRLNFKKVIITIVVLIILVLLAIFAISKIHNNTKNNIENQVNSSLESSNSSNNPSSTTTTEVIKDNPNTIYSDANKTISVELKKSYGLTPIAPTDNRLIVLKSDDNLSLYIAKLDLVPNRDLLDVVTADKESYVSNVGPYSNLTELKELKVGSLRAYTYSLHYLESTSNKAYFLQIVWLESPDGYYIFDVDYPLDDHIYYRSLLTEALSTFTIETFK